MKRHLIIATAVITTLIFSISAYSDTLVLKTGEKITGYYEGGTARTIQFRTAQGTSKDYDILDVQQLVFGEEKTATASSPMTATPAPAAPATSRPPQLRPGSERITRPASTTAATNSMTVPAGSKIVIRMVDSVDSEVQKTGQTFLALLEEPIVLNGVEVAPKGMDVRGRITNAEGAGRIAGSAELGLELTQITVNGIPYSLQTSEYEEVGESRGGQTAKRAGVGAAAGAIIGAIAGGKKGAAVGAGVGAGGATAVQVLTKGQKLRIPAETKLEFSLRAPLVIAGR